VAAEFVDGSLELKPNDSFVAVTRKLEGEELVWTLLGIRNRLIKICDLGVCLP
jgi:hypothetical protein